MVYNEKRSYLEAIRKCYKKVSRKQKGKILDEFCEVCGYNRKLCYPRITEARQEETAAAWLSPMVQKRADFKSTEKDMAGERSNVQ